MGRGKTRITAAITCPACRRDYELAASDLIDAASGIVRDVVCSASLPGRCSLVSDFALEGWADLTRPLVGDRYVPDVDDHPDAPGDLG